MKIPIPLFKKKPAPQVRRALDVETGLPIPMAKGQWLKGKLTYISLVLAAVGAIGRIFGWDLPTEEVNGMATWLAAHWDDLAQFIGLATAAYGRLRINWRKEEQV